MRFIYLIFVFCTLVNLVIAQPIPDEVKSTVAFIYLLNQNKEFVPNGTGFFVGVRNTPSDSGYYVNLVTAKHVLKPDPNKNDYYRTVFVRLNKMDGESDYLQLKLVPEGKHKNIFTHPDSTVDLVVIPSLPDQSIYDFKFLPNDIITTKEKFTELKIREGSNVFFTGLFVPFTGEHRNYPIVRFGRVALITEEKIMWDSIKTDLYLIESSAYGGNSGSPVFFYLEPERKPGGIMLSANPILRLAGVIKGSFNDAKPIQLIETKGIPISVSNMGISAVVPAYKLNEILFSDELKALRK